MDKILIYTEGGFTLGLGNIYRMVELAKSLKASRENIDITFTTTSETYVSELIHDNGFDVKSSNESELIKSIVQQDFNVLVIDKLNVKEDFLKDLLRYKEALFRIVLFGNVSSANKFADLVVNAIIGTNFTNNVFKDSFDTIYLTGPKYLTLRSEFEYMGYQHGGALKNILLLFGGTDQANLSCSVLTDLLQSPNQYNITVVIGKGYKFIRELDAIIENRNNTKILNNISDVSKVMLENDFLITSPGTAMFEGFYLGLPCIALFQNDSQREVFRDFFMTRSYHEMHSIDSCIQSVYNNIEGYYADLKKLEIGQGKQDIINQIIELI